MGDARVVGQLAVASPFCCDGGDGTQIGLQPLLGAHHHGSDFSAVENLAVAGNAAVAKKSRAKIPANKQPAQPLPTALNRGREFGFAIPLVRRHRNRRSDQRRSNLLDGTVPFGGRVFSNKDVVVRAQFKPGRQGQVGGAAIVQMPGGDRAQLARVRRGPQHIDLGYVASFLGHSIGGIKQRFIRRGALLKRQWIG